MSTTQPAKLTAAEFKQTVLEDYTIAYRSRQTSLLGRKEVLTGKAKFGIFGDGKELPQIAMAKAFKNGVTDLMQLQQLMFVLNCKVVMLFSF
jgi:hypothetical protein